MAVKSILSNGYTMNDLFDTYDALQSGSLNQTQVGTQINRKPIPWYKRSGRSYDETSSPIMAGQDNLGSLLGKSEELNAYKKRKQEQANTAQQGAGRTQSILGGTVV